MQAAALARARGSSASNGGTPFFLAKVRAVRYTHEKQKSAELLRLAVPLMTQQDAGLHPVSYAVWYEHVAGENTRLSAHIERLLAQGDPISEVTTLALFNAHIAAIDPAAAEQLAAAIEKVMADMSNSAAQVGNDAEQFGAALARWTNVLSRPGPESVTGSALKAVLQNTQQMQGAIESLQSRLDESRGEIETLRGEIGRSRQEALADSMTGLANRRAFDLALAACLAPRPEDAANDGAADTCLVMADIDHFKRVNDTYGHLFGDKVIRAVAQVLQANTKGRDLVARYGGEEFAIILPNTPLEGARKLAEGIRATIERGRIKRMDKAQTESLEAVTISLGVAVLKLGEGAADLIRRTDQALYQSKMGGRNQVTVATDQV